MEGLLLPLCQCVFYAHSAFLHVILRGVPAAVELTLTWDRQLQDLAVEDNA
jgi:hypothetical protein